MGLDKKFLEDWIFSILDFPPESVEDAAAVWAQAIVEYAADAEFMGTAPGINPSGATDPSPVGSKFKVNPGLVEAGQAILEPALLNGFKMEDPLFIGLQLGIASFIPTLAVWSAGAYTAAVVPVPAAFIPPGYFAGVIAAGLAGAKNEDIAILLSTLIHAGFMTSLLNGAAVNPGGFTSPVVASPII
tara:strand:- start:132 stop:692 length:561 start_codon:yes stop_codon:yes gene_type:complete